MELELNFIDYIGFFGILGLFLYTVIMVYVYSRRRKQLLTEWKFVESVFTPSHIVVMGSTKFQIFKNFILMVKIHIKEHTEFSIREELRRFEIILQAKQPMLTMEKQMRRFSGWAFIITFTVALFGNNPPDWNFVAFLFLTFVVSSELFNLKKYAVNNMTLL